MSEYVPTTMKAREKYALARMMDADRDGEPIMPTGRFHDEFDRWLAEHDRQVKAEAWDEGKVAEREFQNRPRGKWWFTPNPYRIEQGENE